MGVTNSLRCLLLGLLLLICRAVPAGELPAITLIIDDMGNEREQGEAAVSLGSSVTYAFLPYTPHARWLAELAHANGSEVMLHLPMESLNGNSPGPGSLTQYMTREEFRRTLVSDLAAVPHVVGLNNHMGSLLTRHPGAMAWLMAAVRGKSNLIFVDSRTTRMTVAQAIAEEYGIPNTRRDLFLDNDRSPEAINRQFDKLLLLAHNRGFAVAIGHPYPETITLLRRRLPELEARGVRLIPVSQMISLQRRNPQWHAPSFPSLKVAKNSKP